MAPSSKWLTTSLIVALLQCAQTGMRAARAEEVDGWVGQDPNSPVVLNLLGVWQFAWLPNEDHRGIEIDADLRVATRLTIRVGGRSSTMIQGQVGLTAVAWDTRTEAAHPSLWLASDGTACGTASVRLLSHSMVTAAQRRSNDLVGIITTLFWDKKKLKLRESVTGQPRCGPRMVEMVEDEAGARVITCVDRAYTGAESLSQLVMVLAGGLLTWVMAPTPFAGEPYDSMSTTPPAQDPLLWTLPATCHPYFVPRSHYDLVRARRNLAYAFDWVNDQDLLSLQAWQDDQETGDFVLFHEDGRPATIGYRFQGLAHGVWFYLAPDSTLIEARVYALGVLVERLPVETVPAP